MLHYGMPRLQIPEEFVLIIPKLVCILCDCAPITQMNIAWVLFMLSEERNQHITKSSFEQSNIITKLSEFMDQSSIHKTRELVLLTAGNLAIYSRENRIKIVRSGFASKVVKVIKSYPRDEVMRSAFITLSSLFITHNDLNIEFIQELLPTLSDILNNTTHFEIIKASCKLLTYLSSGTPEQAQCLIESGAITKLLDMSELGSEIACKALSDILFSCSGQQLDHVINDCKLFQRSAIILSEHKNSSLCFAISNIVLDHHVYIQNIIESGIIDVLYELFNDDARRCAIITMCIIISYSNHGQVRYLVESGCIESLCMFLFDDFDCILEALDCILSSGDKIQKLTNSGNPYLNEVEAFGRHKMEILCRTKPKASDIIKKYFS
ncbi:importin subunit alpha [Acrasis kona]|uniref:Importin subunit alpha n=1 Tax=Acrasis kona TaxID=1008807 RepID=A0AAW2ZRZ1_9EUKA